MNRRLIVIIFAAVAVLFGLILLIRVLRTPKIITPVITNKTGTDQAGKLADNLKAYNAVDNQYVWQVTGTKLIGYRRDNQETVFSMSLPNNFSDGTALNSISNTILLMSNGDTTQFAVAKPEKNSLVTLPAAAINAALVSPDQVVYWAHKTDDDQTDLLIRQNLDNKNGETLASFDRSFGASFWLVAGNRLVIVPQSATDLSNFDLIIFDLSKKQVVNNYQELGYLFAVSPSGNSIYTTTYNFDKKEVESYYLNVGANTKSKLTRAIQAEPFATGTNDTVYLSALTDGGYDILSLNAGTVKKVNQAVFSYVSSIVVQTSNQLLIGTDNGSQTITLP